MGNLRGVLMLLAASFFWGTTFVAQVVGMEGLGPYSYAALRFALGAACLTLLWVLYRGKRAQMRRAGTYRSGFRAGLPVGLAMFVGVTMQQVALLYTTAGKTAFITTLYIVLVPIGAALLGQRIRPVNWIGAILAFLGVYFLSAYGSFDLNIGDVIVFVSAFFWMVQILLIDRFARAVDGIELCLSQLLVCVVGSTILAGLYETCTRAAVAGAAAPILYGGIFSCGVAYTCQILGQAYVRPAQAAVILSLEAAVAAVAGWLILGEVMSAAQVGGCLLLLAGALITQLPAKGRD